MLSLGLLMSAVPNEWSVDFMSKYPLPDCVQQWMTLAQPYFPGGVQSSVFLAAGVITHVFDCAFVRDFTSCVNLMLWVVCLSLTQIPVIDKYMPIILMVASVVLFLTTMGECRKCKTNKTIAAVKPVQLQKLDGMTNITKKSTKSVIEEEKHVSNNDTKPSNSSVTDPTHPHPVPNPIREHTPEDFGLSKLNVSPRRVTRSQSKHFPTKVFESQLSSDIFKPKPINLSPPRLQLDKSFDYQAPLTRSSSQSSGFVSLSQQKYLDEPRSPLGFTEDLDSVSQCGGNALISYPHSPVTPPFSFSHSYPMPFSQFPHSYAIMHFTPDGFNKFYQFSPITPYDSPLSTISTQNSAQKGWFQVFKTILSSSMFLFLITSNIAILWKVFGEDYFNMKT